MIRLPIDEHLDAIVAGVRAKGALVVVAEPGAGKTTRVPPALLRAGLARDGEIVVLEPRRLAARMAARRVAAELGEEVGQTVGYTVRFEDVGGKKTRIRFVTEGVLARRLADDPELGGIAVVVLDELHERHLHSDLALAFARRLRTTARPDLAIVAMSATIDAEPVARFLECEVARVPGRTFPVDVEHIEAPDDRPLEKQVAAAVRRLAARGLDGDVLVFLPGAGEIRRAREALEPAAAQHGFEIALLHGDLPAAEQDRAVRRGERPKVILSTNVAESSVTIEGVVAVVDSGLARIARHSPWSGLPTLEVAKVSRASATQRAGRAGRVRAGVAIRLYTKHDHDTRPAHDVPEIRRADLTETALLLACLGEDVRAFPFFEPPDVAAVDAAHALLAHLGATHAGPSPGESSVTELGRRASRLPVHPRLAMLLLRAEERGVASQGCLVAALLSEREIRLEMRTSFRDRSAVADRVGASDLLARRDAFEAAERDGLGARAVRAHDLDPGATFAVARVRDQLVRALRPSRDADRVGDAEEEEKALLLATLAAFPDRVGRRRDRASDAIVLAAGGSARLAPTSVVRDSALLIACEVDDRRGGGALVRAASAIEAEDLLELFPDRIREEDAIVFVAARESVERVRSIAYEGLVLDESRSPAEPGPEASRVLVDAVLAAGLGTVCDVEALEVLRLRAAFVHAQDPSCPPLDDAGLDGLLVSAAEGATSFDELRAARLPDLVHASLPERTRRALQDLAPERVGIPGRPGGVDVHYERDRPPWIESRLQDFFGLADGPRIAGGRVPLVLHLLAPNRRAVQVTADLASFWARHYPELRRALSRRYPKHSWPEEPTKAEPPRPRSR